MDGSSSRLPWLLGGLVALLFLCFLVLMVGAVAVPWFLLSSRQPAVATAVPTPRSEALPPASGSTPVPLPPLTSGLDLETEINIRVYEFANPGVVAVRVLDEDVAEQLPDIQPFFFDTGEGSGFVLDTQGHIVTNRHVVQNARNVVVQFYDGVQAPATIVGTDRDSDLAVLKVDPEGLQLRPLPLGSMDELKVGMRVLVIGNPFGNANTLTTGIISALGRQIELPDSQFLLPEVIQTDAAINPGNSGGPMLNERGEVIGMAFMLQSATASNSGIGFGIPVYFVERVAKAIIAEGRYQHPWLGVRGSSLSPFIVRELGLTVDRGVLVAEAIPNGPAAKAGVRGGNRTVTIEGLDLTVGGDIIIAIDGRPIRLFDDLLSYLSRYTSPGQRVVLTVVRGDETLEIPVILEARPETIGD